MRCTYNQYMGSLVSEETMPYLSENQYRSIREADHVECMIYGPVAFGS